MTEKKKKRPPIHKVMLRLLKRKRPERYIATILELLEPGTVVPQRAIPGLIKTLKKAQYEIYGQINGLIRSLKEQREEEERKKAEKKGWIKMA